MSRYNWPKDNTREREDDPAKRAKFTGRRRLDFDLEGAQRASRAPQQPGPRPDGAPAAPAAGVGHLWQPLGPLAMLGGQAEGNPRVSGRVSALSVHKDGQRAYAASANGGVWYTNDGGANWVSLAGLASTDTAGILRPAHRNACGAIEVKFGDAEGDDLVFVGTGEFTGSAGADQGGDPGSSEGGIGILVADKPAQKIRANQNVDPWVREAPNLVNDGVFRIMFETREPMGMVIAATRTGLYTRPAAAGPNVHWVRPPADWEPFNTLSADCTDILWTPKDGTTPERWWVWVKDGPNAGLWVRPNGAEKLKFTKVDVDGASGLSYTDRRACLAASTPASQVWAFNDRGRAATPALFRVTNPPDGDRPTAHGVLGVPNILHEQGFYDIAMAVDPANSDRVALGGSYLGDPNLAADRLLVTTLDGARRGYDASIVVADVKPNPANHGILAYGIPVPAPQTSYTMIGIGVHPDVHMLAYSNGGATLWAGCDGGIFRSDRPTSPAGFYARNQGLSVSETNYIANHPLCEGYLISGLQDNGVIGRVSNGLWRLLYQGDGGGVLIDAVRPDRLMAQYVQGTWYVEGSAGDGPLVRRGRLSTAEDDVAAFYSMPANIEHVRAAPPASKPKFSQTLIGTNRLWYSDNFGVKWVTLPTGKDPLPRNLVQDRLGQAITVCRWQTPDVAWALCEQLLTRYERTSGSHNAGGPGTWASARVIPPAELDSKVWTDIAVNLESPGPGLPPGPRGPMGAIYMGTIGNPNKPDVDTLWWFNGTDKWFPTNLRKDPLGVPAPVTAIVCNPAVPEEVWVGTTVGVWRGLRTDHGAAPPTWAWEKMLNGLPEAVVEDLALFSHDGLVLLRAAIASRGVWELRLDDPDVKDLTYLRAHEDDLRHRKEAIQVKRDAKTSRSWHASPDVRPRLAPTLIPAPSNLPWQRAPFKGTQKKLRRFQTAFRSSTKDPRIVANGLWDAYFSEVLRDHGAPTVTVPPKPPLPEQKRVRIEKPFWESHMKLPDHAEAEPWGAAPPTEADLYEFFEELSEGDVDKAWCSLPPRPSKVDIVIHYRGIGTVKGENVRVALLWWTDTALKKKAKWNNTKTWPTGDPKNPSTVGWTAAVNEVLNSDNGQTGHVLGNGWKFALGKDNESHFLTLPGQILDSMHSAIATFTLDLTELKKKNTLMLLAAVVRTTTNSDPTVDTKSALTEASLQDLVLRNPTVAVRSLRISS